MKMSGIRGQKCDKDPDAVDFDVVAVSGLLLSKYW